MTDDADGLFGGDILVGTDLIRDMITKNDFYSKLNILVPKAQGTGGSDHYCSHWDIVQKSLSKSLDVN